MEEMEEIKDEEQSEPAPVISEIPDDRPDEEPETENKNKRQKVKWLKPAGIILAVVIPALIIVIVVFKPAHRSNRNFLAKQLQRVKITGMPNNNAESVVKPAALPSAPPTTNAVPLAVHVPVKVAKTAAEPFKKTNIQTNLSAAKVPALTPLPGNIKEMLKYNTLINTLKKKAKIAQLEQQIKNLHSNGGFGQVAGGNIAAPSISLVAVTRKTALIAFGKTDVLMTAGMKYDGYECLMVTPSTAALEKNHRVINLSLSM